MGFARIYLRIFGAISMAFGLVYLFAPGGLTDAAGFGATAGLLQLVAVVYQLFQSATSLLDTVHLLEQLGVLCIDLLQLLQNVGAVTGTLPGGADGDGQREDYRQNASILARFPVHRLPS